MIRVRFQSAKATFTDAQLNDYSSRIVATLQQKLGAALRAG
jgi:phenylalanyl-tRNA synthetase beta subunit